MEVFCLRSNVTADAADVHQGSAAAAAAVACVTYCLLSECQAEGGAATEVQLRKGQEVTLPSFTRKEGEYFFYYYYEGKKKVYEAAKDQEGVKAENKRDSSRRAGIQSTSLMY